MIIDRLTMGAFILAIAVGFLSAPAAIGATQRISMKEAKERCFRRTKRFASGGVGPSGRPRSEFEVRSMYKRCIYGYTGKNVRDVPKFRRF